MLLQFIVKNYKSYKDKTVLSFITKSKIRTNEDHEVDIKDLSVIKYASVFGHNASGKTNLFSSMQFLKELVVTGRIENKSVCKDNSDKTISYDVLFEKDNDIFRYFVSIGDISNLNTYKVIDESLSIIGKKKDENLFNFNNIGTTVSEKDEDTIFKQNLYFNNCRNANKLFLSFFVKRENELENSNLQEKVKKAYDFFNNDLIFVTNETDLFSVINDTTIEDISSRLAKYDTGITNLRFARCSSEEVRNNVPQQILDDIQQRFQEVQKEKNGSLTVSLTNGVTVYHFKQNKEGEIVVEAIKSTHTGFKSPFDYDEESDGTRRIVLLCSLLFGRNEKDKVFIFDEFEKSLHPCLARAIIRDFMEYNKSNNSQLIITTHLPLLMDNVFRKDEIFIVEKSYDGVSTIYPLSCFKGGDIRTDKKISKNYFEGRYGGVPAIDKVIL